LGCEFIGNHQLNLPGLHPGLGVTASVNNLLVSGNAFSDDQETPTQLYPIQADGPITLTNVMIHGNRLTAYGARIGARARGSVLRFVAGFRQYGLQALCRNP
jgi:hypothetical protein